MKLASTLTASILAMAATTANATSWTAISECGYQITETGNYRLEVDLDCADTLYQPAISIIQTTDVKLDLNGKTILGKPNPTYFGTGTGIIIYDSNDVELEGDGARLAYFQSGIRIQDSYDIKIDGDQLEVRDSYMGLFAFRSHDLEIDDLQLRHNKARDIYLNKAHDVDLEEVNTGGAIQGILLSETVNVRLKRVKIGENGQHQKGLILFNTTQTEFKFGDIMRSGSGVLASGATTQDNEITHTNFKQNDCDYQSALGADPPLLDNNQPNNLYQCAP